MLSFNIVHSLVHIITSLHSKFHFIIYRNKKKVLVCLACSIVSAITVCFQDYMLICQDNEEKIGHFFMTKITITPSFINPYKKCWCHFVPFGKLYPMQLELEHSKQILFFVSYLSRLATFINRAIEVTAGRRNSCDSRRRQSRAGVL